MLLSSDRVRLGFLLLWGSAAVTLGGCAEAERTDGDHVRDAEHDASRPDGASSQVASDVSRSDLPAPTPDAPALAPDLALTDAPRGVLDAPLSADARPGSGGDGGAFCLPSAFRECGGELTGEWDILGYCDSEGGSGAASGTLTFQPDMTYSFLLLSSQSPSYQARPVPEVGTYTLMGSRVVLKSTKNNGAVFPNRGSLAYRTDQGHTSPYCVSGGDLQLDAGRLRRTFIWTFRKKR